MLWPCAGGPWVCVGGVGDDAGGELGLPAFQLVLLAMLKERKDSDCAVMNGVDTMKYNIN